MRWCMLALACTVALAVRVEARPVIFPAAAAAGAAAERGAPYEYRQGESPVPAAPSGFSSRPFWRGIFGQSPRAGAVLQARVQELAGRLLADSGEELAAEHILAVSTLVNLHNLYRTSSFGRYVSEQLISALRAAGLEVIELRKTPSVMISRGNGEFGLSRDMAQLDFVHPVSALVTGTYIYADGELFLNARVVRNSDGMVLAAADLVFPLDPLTEELLADEKQPVKAAAPVRVRSLVTQER